MAWVTAAAGDVCYVGTTGSPAIFDVTDPGAPVMIGETTEPAPVLDISRSTLAAITGRATDLVLYDITDPTAPVELSRLAPPDGFYLNWLSIDDSLAVTIGRGDLPGFGITDPHAPVVASSLIGVADCFGTVLVDGSTVYLTVQGEGIATSDVSDPSNIVQRGFLGLTSIAMDGMDIQGTTLYVTRDTVLTIVDVSDPASPALVSEWAGSYAQGVRVSGAYAYVANDDDWSFDIVDVSDPSTPVLAGWLDAYGMVYFLDVAGTTACVADQVYGLLTADVSDPTNPVQVGTGPSFGTEAVDVILQGSTGFAASSGGELSIFDLADPLNPVEVSRLTSGFFFMGSLAIDGNVLGVRDATGTPPNFTPGLEFHDVSAPASPVLLSTLADTAGTPGMRPGEGHATEGGRFFNVFLDRLVVVDVTDPVNPFIAPVYPDPPGPRLVGWDVIGGVTAANGLIYLAGYAGLETLRFLDVGVFLDAGADTVTVAPGGSISYDATIENFTTAPQTFDVWTDVVQPGGGTVGPLLGPVPVTLPAGQVATVTLNPAVPADVPPGTYTLYGHVGTYGGTDLDDDHFVVEVTP